MTHAAAMAEPSAVAAHPAPSPRSRSPSRRRKPSLPLHCPRFPSLMRRTAWYSPARPTKGNPSLTPGSVRASRPLPALPPPPQTLHGREAPRLLRDSCAATLPVASLCSLRPPPRSGGSGVGGRGGGRGGGLRGVRHDVRSVRRLGGEGCQAAPRHPRRRRRRPRLPRAGRLLPVIHLDI